jgi:hypothetical protein
MIPMIPCTTALVAARPTSDALRPAASPVQQPASATKVPKQMLLVSPMANCVQAIAGRNSSKNTIGDIPSMVTQTIRPPSSPMKQAYT